MTIQQVQAQRERIRRAAGLVALEYQAQGTTPGGMSAVEHQQSIYDESVEQAEQMAATGAMTWVVAAGMTAEVLEGIAKKAMEGQKP